MAARAMTTAASSAPLRRGGAAAGRARRLVVSSTRTRRLRTCICARVHGLMPALTQQFGGWSTSGGRSTRQQCD
eukprot:scaffold133113_cov60-Phaeocystis_antarctica.AAC.1